MFEYVLHAKGLRESKSPYIGNKITKLYSQRKQSS
ncbi:unnamed protein product [Arabidopsis halleri]